MNALADLSSMIGGISASVMTSQSMACMAQQQNQLDCCRQSAQQSINLNNFASGLQQVKPEMLAKLTWGHQSQYRSEEKADPDYEAALKNLDEEFPGLRE